MSENQYPKSMNTFLKKFKSLKVGTLVPGFLRSSLLILLITVFTIMGLMAAGIIPYAKFTREIIEITIYPKAIEVNGLYVYENPFPVTVLQGLRIPFPDSPFQIPPATVQVSEIDNTGNSIIRRLPVNWIGGIPYFSTRIPSNGTTYVRVTFRQRTTENKGIYLLKTTAPWIRPLEHGMYILKPKNIKITGSNYPLKGKDELYFERKEFYPLKNWIFSWEAKKQ